MSDLVRADKGITIAERVTALDRLETIGWELNQIASWLAGSGVETESDMIERAARDLLASCWLLSRPLRPEPSAERWQGP